MNRVILPSRTALAVRLMHQGAHVAFVVFPGAVHVEVLQPRDPAQGARFPAPTCRTSACSCRTGSRAPGWALRRRSRNTRGNRRRRWPRSKRRRTANRERRGPFAQLARVQVVVVVDVGLVHFRRRTAGPPGGTPRRPAGGVLPEAVSGIPPFRKNRGTGGAPGLRRLSGWFRWSTTRMSVSPRSLSARTRLLPMNPAPPRDDEGFGHDVLRISDEHVHKEGGVRPTRNGVALLSAGRDRDKYTKVDGW